MKFLERAYCNVPFVYGCRSTNLNDHLLNLLTERAWLAPWPLVGTKDGQNLASYAKNASFDEGCSSQRVAGLGRVKRGFFSPVLRSLHNLSKVNRRRWARHGSRSGVEGKK